MIMTSTSAGMRAGSFGKGRGGAGGSGTSAEPGGSGDIVPDVRKIAVLRANGLGDFIFTLPALDALRQTYPGAEIVLLGKAWHRDFLDARPGPIDRVVVVPRARGVGASEDAVEDPSELERFFAAMRAERFDLAFQLHGGGRYSNPFVNRLGARRTIGLKTPDAQPLDRWVPYVYFQSEVFRMLEVVALAGVRTTAVEPRLTPCELDLDEAGRNLPATKKPIAVVNVGAGDARRRWLPERFAQVGDALADAGALVVLNGVGDERALVEAVAQRMRRPAIDLGSDCTHARLTGTLARAAVVVSCDSGPLHLARALGAATVGIYWCGNLINAGPTTRTRHRPFVSWRLECASCGRNTMTGRCAHDSSFVDWVEAEPVAEAALELLALATCRTSTTRARRRASDAGGRVAARSGVGASPGGGAIAGTFTPTPTTGAEEGVPAGIGALGATAVEHSLTDPFLQVTRG